MVSKYDVFYAAATKGECRIADILDALGKPKEDYQNIFNKAIELEKEGYIERKGAVRIVHSKKSKELFELISFCMHNGINYNAFFKKEMLRLLEKASKKEMFTIADIKMHPQTFKLYTQILEKSGLLIIMSKKPLKCKLLRHHFIAKLLSFFGLNPRFYKPKASNLIKEIRKEIAAYKRKARTSFAAVEDINRNDEIKFIFLSLNLEGNPMTLPDTQKLIRDKIISSRYNISNIEEVTNYKKAVDLMIANSKKGIRLSLPLILEYHRVAMAHIGEAGRIRKENVRIKKNPDFETSDWKDIPKRIQKLMNQCEDFEKEKRDIEEVIRFASYFHNEFQRIHPFIDGNSRISRLLMLHILRRHSIPILDMSLGYFDLYLDLTKRSKKRDDEAFYYLVQEMCLTSLKRTNARI